VLALTLLLPLTGGAQPVAGFPEHAPVRQVALLDSPTGTHQDVEGDSEEASEDEAPYLPDPDAEPKRHRIEGLAVPLISYSTDFGVGYGGTGGMYVYHPDYYPFRWALSAQAYWTTRSIQNHYIRLDAPQLIGDARIEARGEYRRELLSPYFGLGNASAPGFSGNLADPRVNYARTFPGGWVRARYRPFGLKHPFEPWISYGFNLFDVAPIAGSVLEQDQPRGIEGGRDGQLSIGMSWDTRDDQHATTRGGSEEIALRAAGRLTFGDYGYVGVTLVERRFWQLGSKRLVLAQRVVLDWLFGDVPFFELSNVGGLQGAEGIGGMSSVRGVPRNRYVGEVKVFSNTELRWNPLDFTVLGNLITAGGLVFFDVGRTWSKDADDGPWHLWHPGAGVGIRFTRRAAVARVDAGFDLQTFRPGLYVTLSHMF